MPKSDPSLIKNLLVPGQCADLYGIVLAAGKGKRMEEFISRYYGSANPKQYVAFTGKRSMVQHTIQRVEKLISREKILVVVDPKHRDLINRQMSDRPAGTLIYQPANCETAPGILLPLAYIYKNNPDCTVAIFPSDHFVLEEERLMDHVRCARRVLQLSPEQIVLLGVAPGAPEVEYGWIQPAERLLVLNDMEISGVARFHEKPEPASAREFFKKGYLWNTLMMIARCSTLWTLLREALPRIHSQFEKIREAIGTPREQTVIGQEYQRMEKATVSHMVLEKFPERLLVIKVTDVFWSDWGNGFRVLDTLKQIGAMPQASSGCP